MWKKSSKMHKTWGLCDLSFKAFKPNGLKDFLEFSTL